MRIAEANGPPRESHKTLYTLYMSHVFHTHVLQILFILHVHRPWVRKHFVYIPAHEWEINLVLKEKFLCCEKML